MQEFQKYISNSPKMLSGQSKTLTQGSPIGVRRLRTYTYFYWRTHDFGHANVDTYAHFFAKNF